MIRKKIKRFIRTEATKCRLFSISKWICYSNRKQANAGVNEYKQSEEHEVTLRINEISNKQKTARKWSRWEGKSSSMRWNGSGRMTLVSSSMAEMRSERRSKQRSGSGDLWVAEATMDSSCATSTPKRDSGAAGIWFFDMWSNFHFTALSLARNVMFDLCGLEEEGLAWIAKLEITCFRCFRI